MAERSRGKGDLDLPEEILRDIGDLEHFITEGGLDEELGIGSGENLGEQDDDSRPYTIIELGDESDEEVVDED